MMINEIFYAPQGEGLRAGSPSIFVRFTGCNLQCRRDNGAGFDCDTEFSSGIEMTKDELLSKIKNLSLECKWIVFTGGEPSLQLNKNLDLIPMLVNEGFFIAIETNGTNELVNEELYSHICVSPKTAEHTIRQKKATEVKYVRKAGQGIPKPSCVAAHKYLSPAFDPHGLSNENLEWCLKLILENPEWSLSVQNHKLWGVR